MWPFKRKPTIKDVGQFRSLDSSSLYWRYCQKCDAMFRDAEMRSGCQECGRKLYKVFLKAGKQ